MLAILVGVAVLLGWAFDIAPLKSVLPGLVSMKSSTALTFVLCGTALVIASADRPGRAARLLGLACASAAAGIGLLALGAWVLGRSLWIDQLLFPEAPGATATTVPGRMAPATAFSFAVIGSALLLVDRGRLRRQRAAQALALVALLPALLALIGYVTSAEDLTGIGGETAMALNTASTFVALAGGIVCATPGVGLMRLLASEHAGGVIVRRLLPAAVLLFPLIGWLRLEGQSAGLFGTRVGVSLLVFAAITLTSAAVWHTAWTLDRAEVEREQAQDALHQTEATLRAIADNTPATIYVKDRDHRYRLVNTELERLFDRPRDELLGRTAAELLPAEVAAAVGTEDRRVIEEGAVLQVEETASRNGEARTYLSLKFPLLDAHGAPEAMCGISTDITERKQAEEQLRALAEVLEARVAERTLELSVANRELEAFTYSVSHDLRAPLRAVNGFSRILLKEHASELPEQGRRYLRLVQEGATTMGELIDDLLMLSRIGREALSVQWVAPGDVARQALQELTGESEGRHLEVAFDDLPPCRADPRLLKHVYLNLLSNALKFTRERDRAIVQIGWRPPGDAETQAAYFVRDNGVGFDPRYAHKLFAAFQRLHRAEDFEGTGVGLTIVQRIVHRHGGEVWAQSNPDQGATFYFTIGGSDEHAPA